MARNGSDRAAVGWRGRSDAWLILCALAMPVTAQKEQDPALQEQLGRLNDQLTAPGPDGREQRDRAIQQLLTMPNLAAHQVLCRLLARDDETEARKATLDALAAHLIGTRSSLFGSAAADVRRDILVGYVGVLARCWRSAAATPVAPGGGDAVRTAARAALMRVPPQDLLEAVRTVAGAVERQDRGALFACIADLRQLQLASVIADYLENEDVPTRDGARVALATLTFQDEPFLTRAQFTSWFEQNSSTSYVELAERAARSVTKRVHEVQAQVIAERLRRSRDVVRAYAEPTAGINWAGLQREVIVDDPAAAAECIAVLQEMLANGIPADGAPASRQQFCRALLDRWKLVPEGETLRRAQLLEVIAYATRPEDGDFAGEVQRGLVAQLDGGGPGVLAALRGLRRFAGAEARARIVRHALAAVADRPNEVEAAVTTMLTKGTPRWCAPQPTDADKPDWLQLIRAICERPEFEKLREQALSLAMLPDAKDQLVPEVFANLVDLARNGNVDASFRVKCIFNLQGWKNPEGVGSWLSTLHALLADAEPQVRLNAANALGRFPDLADNDRQEWLESTIAALRARLKEETDKPVVEALVATLVICGSEPKMPELAITAINTVLADLAPLPAADTKDRIERLLVALTVIAGDKDAAGGAWIGACGPLLAAQSRKSLLGVLELQHAHELAKDVGSKENGDLALSAMECVIRTALLKSPDKPWSLPELQTEAGNVVRAFKAIDNLPPAARPAIQGQRLLRVEVELAAKQANEAVAHAKTWLAITGPAAPGAAPDATPLTPQIADAMRTVAAEALLTLNKPDEAGRMLMERDPMRAVDARAAAAFAKVAEALATTDQKTAVEYLDRARLATPAEDKATYRQRLIDWAVARRNLDPGAREAVWAEVAPFAALFEAVDCPPKLRDAFQHLRDTR